MQYTIASGKGGTGKTLLATNMAVALAERGEPTAYVDADAEEPNGHLFLECASGSRRRFSVPRPVLADPPCSGCGRCQEICEFGAILVAGGDVTVFDELCHGCGACLLACPEDALIETSREIGTISTGICGGGLRFLSARLDIGEPRAAPLIDGLLERASDFEGRVLVDAPPGTTCNAMAAVRHAEIVLLVAEPTPFGQHDLELTIEMCRALDLRVAAVINRCDLGDDAVRRRLAERSIPVLAEIPFLREVAAEYAAGRLASKRSSALRAAIKKTIDGLEAMSGGFG